MKRWSFVLWKIIKVSNSLFSWFTAGGKYNNIFRLLFPRRRLDFPFAQKQQQHKRDVCKMEQHVCRCLLMLLLFHKFYETFFKIKSNLLFCNIFGLKLNIFIQTMNIYTRCYNRRVKKLGICNFCNSNKKIVSYLDVNFELVAGSFFFGCCKIEMLR